VVAVCGCVFHLSPGLLYLIGGCPVGVTLLSWIAEDVRKQSRARRT
jgi:hypothetical protein